MPLPKFLSRERAELDLAFLVESQLEHVACWQCQAAVTLGGCWPCRLPRCHFLWGHCQLWAQGALSSAHPWNVSTVTPHIPKTGPHPCFQL